MAHTNLRARASNAVWGRIALLALLATWCMGSLTVGAQARGLVGLELTSRAGEAEGSGASVLEQVFPTRAAPTYVTVWQGLDVDGDGAADFANPTGQAPRAHDAFGSGAYGASRDGGHREHEGVDYTAEAGQTVVAPISGYVSRIGYAYGDDPNFRYVEIINPALRYQARVFYVDPDVEVGQAVHVGSPIGAVRSLQGRYAGITDHVHLEIEGAGHGRMDATRLIAARTVAVGLRG